MVKIQVTAKEYLPIYATEGSAGADLKSVINYILEVGERKVIPTGIKMAIPNEYEVQIRPRSGLALKYGITMPNSPGTIDSDYRGEVGVILQNLGEEPFVINEGDRIAQMVLSKHSVADFIKVEKLDETERTGGFGSTGVN